MGKVANHAEYCKKPIEDKISLSKKILANAINEFKIDKTLLAWTGGKDSTLILWMLLELQAEKKIQMPDCLFINEGCVFDEILGFVKKIERKHKLNVYHAINKDVFDLAKGKPGNIVLSLIHI